MKKYLLMLMLSILGFFPVFADTFNDIVVKNALCECLEKIDSDQPTNKEDYYVDLKFVDWIDFSAKSDTQNYEVWFRYNKGSSKHQIHKIWLIQIEVERDNDSLIYFIKEISDIGKDLRIVFYTQKN